MLTQFNGTYGTTIAIHSRKGKILYLFEEILNNEYELSKKMVLPLSGYQTLMEEEPISKSSISIREDIVLPVLIIQRTALQEIEKDNTNKEKM